MEGIDELTQGLAFYRATGASSGVPRLLGWLAEAYGRAGRVDEAFATLAEALSLIERDGEQLWEGELYRRKGELLLNAERGTQNDELNISSVHRSSLRVPHSAEAEAEAYFLKAIAITQQQQAKLFELRATTSLARLWRRQGKQGEARLMLSKIYHWFTEGLHTADLQEAGALVAELG